MGTTLLRVGWLLLICLMGLSPRPAQADMPSFAAVQARYAASDTLLLDRHGAPLHQLRRDETRRQLAWTPLAEISPALVQSVLAAEDHRFWQHGGVAWQAVIGAVWDRLFRGVQRGASTVTMQLAALLDPHLRASTGRRSWSTKWAQMQAAWALEKNWSKAQILEAYLNLVTFRGELQGILAASQSLFDKQPSGLERAEALLLAALLRSPNASAEKTASRACVLAHSSSFDLVCVQLRELADRLLAGSVPHIRLQAAWAPHVAQQLLGQHTTSPKDRPIVSTLDGPLQRFTLDALTRQLHQLQDSNVQNGVALVVDNASGQVLAYVGNAGDYPATRQVDGVHASRQAGSTLKPFLYQLAMEQHLLTPASLLEDAPVEMVTPRGIYQPQNYDRIFHGWVSVRTALAASVNVPAVRTLLLTGLDPFVLRLQQLGFSHVTDEGAFYGYALALGSVEVSLWQLVNAYRTLANGGLFTPLTLRLDAPVPAAVRLLSAPATFMVADILADASARSSTFGLDSPLVTPFWSAVKTGTSKQMRDNWCIGFTRQYTVGVWVGNFDGQPMQQVSGVSGAAPAWLEIMAYLHPTGAAAPPTAPPAPGGVTRIQTAFQPPVEPPRSEWFLTGTELAVVTLNDTATRPARILYPGNGTILAMDPDIPTEQQRLFVRMDPNNANFHWRMDDQPLDPEEGWLLTQGRHRLALTDADAQMVDSVHFVVRGYKKKEMATVE
ncbi:MAG: penicillin-binding protein 1C [Magnetococcales bacterium]|nr:penicillin-binding protein 1C [Magnetococcales bacterium]